MNKSVICRSRLPRCGSSFPTYHINNFGEIPSFGSVSSCLKRKNRANFIELSELNNIDKAFKTVPNTLNTQLMSVIITVIRRVARAVNAKVGKYF